MHRTVSYNLAIVLSLVISMLLAAAGAAYAHPTAAPGPASGPAQCYRALREDLGTVLPSGWRGYKDQNACSLATARLQAVSTAKQAALAASLASSRVDLSACFRALHEDLGTVLPGRESGFLASACSAMAKANAGTR